MNFSLRLLLALLLSGGAFIRGRAASPAAVAPAFLETLNSFRHAYVQAQLAGPMDPVAASFADGIRLMPEFQRTVVGRAGALAYYRAFAARMEVRAFTRERVDILDLGARLVEVGRFTEKLVPRAGGQASDLNGKYLDLWEKSADGPLRLVTQAWNYDGAVEIGDELRFAEVPAFVAAFQGRAAVTSSVSFELAALGRLLAVVVTEHDTALFSRYYADDAILLPNFGPLCRGRKEIDAYVADHFAHLPIFEQLDIRNDRIEELDGCVIEYASHVAHWRNGDSSGVNTGKNLRIWRREPDHSLKIIRQIGMYD